MSSFDNNSFTELSWEPTNGPDTQESFVNGEERKLNSCFRKRGRVKSYRARRVSFSDADPWESVLLDGESSDGSDHESVLRKPAKYIPHSWLRKHVILTKEIQELDSTINNLVIKEQDEIEDQEKACDNLAKGKRRATISAFWSLFSAPKPNCSRIRRGTK